MESDSQGGGDRAGQRWPVTVTGVAGTRGGSLATPLLRNQEVSLHLLQPLHLRIAIVVNVRQRDCHLSTGEPR